MINDGHGVHVLTSRQEMALPLVAIFLLPLSQMNLRYKMG
jgi:hypothetical protein